VEKFLTASLTALQVEYVDLYLIHLPVGFQDNGDGNLFPKDYTGALLMDPSTDHISLWKVHEAQVIVLLFWHFVSRFIANVCCIICNISVFCVRDGREVTVHPHSMHTKLI